MTDPLSVFFTQPIEVKRLTGSGPYGDSHAPEATVLCRLKYETRLVRDTSGSEVVAQATASMPIDTDPIPAGSLVQVGDHTHTVIGDAHHRGGFPQSPDYYSIDLA